MKNVKQEPKFDFYQILYRRRWTVARWAENQGINSQDKALSWVSANEGKYFISEQFLQELFDFVSLNESKQEAKKQPELVINEFVSNSVEEKEEVKAELLEEDNTSELIEPVQPKTKGKKKVQTEEEAE